MKNIGIGLIVLILISSSIQWVNPSVAQSWSPSEQELWNLEKAYMTLLQEGNIQELSEFWHKDFFGWPSHSSEPLNRDESVKSLKALLADFKSTSFNFHPKAIQITGDIAVVHYQVEFEIQTADEVKKKDSYRVTHTWLNVSGDWIIVGGMSSR